MSIFSLIYVKHSVNKLNLLENILGFLKSFNVLSPSNISFERLISSIKYDSPKHSLVKYQYISIKDASWIVFVKWNNEGNFKHRSISQLRVFSNSLNIKLSWKFLYNLQYSSYLQPFIFKGVSKIKGIRTLEPEKEANATYSSLQKSF